MHKNLTPEDAQKLLDSKKIDKGEILNSEDFVLSRVGKELYEAFYLNYTIKQWDRHPKDLDKSVCGRIPVKLNRNPYYVNHKFRKTPKEGFTAMFAKMLDHPNIETRLNTDYFDLKSHGKPRIGTIYTGPIDRYFNYKFGTLDWRSLEFKFQTIDKEIAQECVQINYPNDHEYTRSVEIKHVTKQQHLKTVVCKEYPKADGDPYYPVPNQEARNKYLEYKALADQEVDVHFVGRLAEYTYINTDEAVLRALEIV